MKTRLLCGLGLGAMVALSAMNLAAQGPGTTKEAAPPRRGNDPARRVPPYFGQLGLTPEQRDQIYKIQSKQLEKIEALERQLAEARAQMLAECEGVLTEPQKNLLEQRRKASNRGTPKPASPASSRPAEATKKGSGQ